MTKTLDKKSDMTNINVPVDAINKLAEILKDQELTEIEVELEGLGKIKVRKEASGVIVSNPVAAPAASPVVNATAPAANSAQWLVLLIFLKLSSYGWNFLMQRLHLTQMLLLKSVIR